MKKTKQSNYNRRKKVAKILDTYYFYSYLCSVKLKTKKKIKIIIKKLNVMKELYWLTRLDDVKLLIGFIIGFAVLSIVVGICAMAYNIDRHYDDEKLMFKIGKKTAIISVIIAFVFSIGTCFIPSTKDAYMIYGIGGTIDYVKSNETAKQLPDKCIQALDKYLTDEIKK